MNTEAVESLLRAVVAERLGVDTEELTPDVSLADDLAADSLDLVELELALESELGIALRRRELEELRTFGDLVAAAVGELTRRESVRGPTTVPPEVADAVWARVVLVEPDRRAGVQRADYLTPYGVETIAEDATRAGTGSRIELLVPTGTSDAVVEAVQHRFVRLAAQGIEVRVRRGPWVGETVPPAPLPAPRVA